MKFTPTTIPDVQIITPVLHEDERGFFMETFRTALFADAGIAVSFIQENNSGSAQGTLRGLHYQIHQAQGKLVQVVSGEIFDVAVDIRKSSSSFGKWVGKVLSGDNKQQVWIPAGFAHGYYVLSEWAIMIYKVTDYYSPEWERTLLWNDPELKIDWPLNHGIPLLISDRDADGIPLKDIETFG
jgi:dTDP-4-dehydrorhamnose 3,5-epimerase